MKKTLLYGLLIAIVFSIGVIHKTEAKVSLCLYPLSYSSFDNIEYKKCLEQQSINNELEDKTKVEQAAKEEVVIPSTPNYEEVIKTMSDEMVTLKNNLNELKDKTTNDFSGCFVGANFSPTTGKSCLGFVPTLPSFDGCDKRDYGFSITTGKSCVGNTVLVTQ